MVELLADRVGERRRGRWLRVGIDGAAAAAPETLAAALVAPLGVRGRHALPVATAGFWRPASLRFEAGRTDPDAFYERWLDHDALRREVLDRLGPDGEGRVLPDLWDPAVDRATRSGYVSVPAGGVVLVCGALLLGAGLPFDFTVHLALSPAALARRTPPELRWTLPAYARYEREVRPRELADVVVRLDDPRHPALVEQP